MLITLPPPLFRQPAEVTRPPCAATTCDPYGAAMSTARWPAWKYWLYEPPGTGQASRPAAGGGAAPRDEGPVAVATSPMPVGAASGVASGSIATGVGRGSAAGTWAAAPRSMTAGSSAGWAVRL